MKFASQIVFPAPDLAAAKTLFAALLDTKPYADTEYYVGYRVDGMDIGLDPNAQHAGPVAYWETDDIAASVEQLTTAGARSNGEPRDVGGGLLVTTLTDPSGNVIGLRQSA